MQPYIHNICIYTTNNKTKTTSGSFQQEDFKEVGWSTDYPSDLSQTFKDIIFGHNLLFREEKIQIFGSKI